MVGIVCTIIQYTIKGYGLNTKHSIIDHSTICVILKILCIEAYVPRSNTITRITIHRSNSAMYEITDRLYLASIEPR